MKIFLSKNCHFRFLRVFLKSKKVNIENNFYYKFYISRNNTQYRVWKRVERTCNSSWLFPSLFLLLLCKKTSLIFIV